MPETVAYSPASILLLPAFEAESRGLNHLVLIAFGSRARRPSVASPRASTEPIYGTELRPFRSVGMTYWEGDLGEP
jgi:hypothetical protein